MMGLQNEYEIIPSPLNEEAVQVQLQEMNLNPVEYVRQLAESKCMALVNDLESHHDSVDSFIIIGSDTIVDLNGTILEKPTNEQNACEMLSKLSNQWHEVHTGVSITHVNNKEVIQRKTFAETSQVKFYELSEGDISAYVKTGEPMDKAGSYGIQGIGGQMVERIQGDFFNIMGLPMHRLSVELCHILSE